jgi:type IV pilus assembly protein PilV
MIILNKTKSQAGFTLIELLIAVTILACGLLATATMQGIAMNANSTANRLSVANSLGQQVADDLVSLSSLNSLLTTSVSNATYNRMYDPLAPTVPASSVSIPGAGTFTAAYSIAPNNPTSGTTRVSVNVVHNGSTIASYTTYRVLN